MDVRRKAGRFRAGRGACFLPAPARGRAPGGRGPPGKSGRGGGAMKLIGVGVGPGDPDLVTVKAVRVLAEADVVLVPVLAAGEPGRAEATVRAHVSHGRIRRVAFAFAFDGQNARQRPEAAWGAAATAVIEAFAAGAEAVAVATIGD